MGESAAQGSSNPAPTHPPLYLKKRPKASQRGERVYREKKRRSTSYISPEISDPAPPSYPRERQSIIPPTYSHLKRRVVGRHLNSTLTISGETFRGGRPSNRSVPGARIISIVTTTRRLLQSPHHLLRARLRGTALPLALPPPLGGAAGGGVGLFADGNRTPRHDGGGNHARRER